MSTHTAPSSGASWWRERLTSDLPASFVVFLVALPLSMGIAIASGASVTSGLVSGIVGGIVTGLLAGAPLQVSGPAAGLSVIIYQCILEYGIEELGIVVLLAGGMQVAGGALRLGQWFRAVSPAVIQGMLAGIGVLIFASQFHVMVDDKPKQSGLANLFTIPDSIAKAIPNPQPEGGEKIERNLRTSLLKETGLLHLKQVEIGEQVHHALTGIAGPLADSAAPQDEAEETSAPQALSPDETAPLIAAQEAVITELEKLRGNSELTLLSSALRDCREALADLKAGNEHTARASQDRAADSIAQLRDSVKSHRWAAGLGIVTIVVLIGWQAFLGRRLPFIPAPLAAVGVATLAAVFMNLPVLYVEVPDNLLEEVYWPSLAELKSAVNPALVLMAAQIAVVASAQTLLSATAVDQLHRGQRTQYDRELVAQGVGNMICGLLAALPLAGVIVRSTANINAGAKSRWSTVLHGVWLLLFVAGLSFILRMIPTASLAAILVYTGYKLINLNTVKKLWSVGRSEAAIYLATLVSIVAFDLLIGVGVGLGLSVLKLLYTFTYLRIILRQDAENHQATMILRGSATFLKLPRLAQALEEVAPGTELTVQIDRLTYIDHACLDLLVNWEKQHAATGGRVVIDWESLNRRFRAPAIDAASPTVQEKESRADGDGRGTIARPRKELTTRRLS
jgi:MFS superfamily sulfate permease-like transporter